MIKFYSFLIVSLFAANTSAQDWQRTLGTSGNDVPFQLETISNGKTIILWNTDQFGTTDEMVTCIDSIGEILWNKKIQLSGGISYLYKCIVDASDENNYFFLTFKSPFNGSSSIEDVVKMDESGNILWTKRYESYVMSGYKCEGLELLSNEVIFSSGRIRINASGDTIQTKRYESTICPSIGGPTVLYTKFITRSSGNYIGVGYLGETGFITEFNALNDTVWTLGAFTPAGSVGVPLTLIELNDGSIITSGSNFSTIYKLNNIGIPQWIQMLTDGGSVVIKSLIKADDGGFFAIGNTTGQGFGNTDIFIIKFDNNGIKEWTKLLGSTLSDELYDAKLDRNGNILIVGSTLNFDSQNQDILIINIGQDGTSICDNIQGGNFSSTFDYGPFSTCVGMTNIGHLGTTTSVNTSTATDLSLNDTTLCNSLIVGYDEFLNTAYKDAILYPNPTSGIIMIEGINEGKFEIVNSIGTVILTGNLNLPIDVSEFTSGLYFITIDHRHLQFIKE